jgi:hypothetical protein
MIYSPKYDFAFLASSKTGSTSIHNYLKNINDPNKIVKTKIGDDKHINFKKYKKKYKKNEGFSFAFVRNPWGRVLSWYFFVKNSKNPKRNSSNLSFSEFIKERQNVWAAKPQGQFDFTEGCSFIGRMENIQNDFNFICEKIGIEKIELKKSNSRSLIKKQEHFSFYYSQKDREIVKERFSKDIEFFNYKFKE